MHSAELIENQSPSDTGENKSFHFIIFMLDFFNAIYENVDVGSILGSAEIMIQDRAS